MNYSSLADKWEQKRQRHKHQHPPLLNVMDNYMLRMEQQIEKCEESLQRSWWMIELSREYGCRPFTTQN